MKVEMLRLMCSPVHGNRQPGDVVDMDEAEALKRVANGDCKALEEPKASRTRSRKPATPPTPPASEPDTPVEKMTVEQLKAYAAEHEIDLGDATLKDDIRAKVAAAIEARRDEDGGED